MADSDDPIYVSPIDKERRKVMQAYGVPGQDFMPKGGKFDVSQFLIGMEVNLPSVSSKIISAERQAGLLRSILNAPLKKPYLIGISSYPSDNRAKYLAHTIMDAAITDYESNRVKQGTKSKPIWHRVWGNLGDKLREGPKQYPSMLIISNLHDESSSNKIEKVRDLLEMYSDIPRIVVAGGAPIVDLFTYRLSLPLSAGFYVGPPNLIKDNK